MMYETRQGTEKNINNFGNVFLKLTEVKYIHIKIYTCGVAWA